MIKYRQEIGHAGRNREELITQNCVILNANKGE